MAKVKVYHHNTKTNIVKLDEKQVKDIVEYLDRRMDDYSDRISKSNILSANLVKDTKDDTTTFIIKALLGGFLILFGSITLYLLFFDTSKILPSSKSFYLRFVTFTTGVVSIFWGIDICKEKDRNYIIQIFSSLVSLLALIISYFALKS